MLMSALKEANEERPRICIITTPRPKAGIIPLSNLVDVLHSLSSYLYVITGNEAVEVLMERRYISGCSLTSRAQSNMISEIIQYIFLQMRISYHVLSIINKVDMFIFFEGECLLLPLLAARISGKPTVLSLAASVPDWVDAEKNPSLVFKMMKFLELSNYRLSHTIVLFSAQLIKDWHLEKYRAKIAIAHNHFLDLEEFGFGKESEEREYLLGYIGRFGAEKGALNLARSTPELLKHFSQGDILIGGSGPLAEKMVEVIGKDSLARVKMPGWIDHQDLPEYLKELRLIILPSYTEGLPNIMIEAMACGAVVLATSVGAISEYIKDEETGFLMEDNSPKCIIENAIRALNCPELDRIARNARSLVEREFSYEVAVRSWQSALESIRRAKPEPQA
jgi:glycosyltransferase involved in cell wall biosynthesis